MVAKESVTHYWNYAELLNEQLGKTASYVEPDELNYDTYSVTYTNILLSACSEIEVVAKLICQIIDPNVDYLSSEIPNKDGTKMVRNRVEMVTLSSTLLKRFPHIYQTKAEIINKHKMIYPLECWKEKNCEPPWWKAYNMVKHYRHQHFNDATLENTLNSVAALIILNSYLYELVMKQHAPHMSRIGMFDSCYSYCGLVVQPDEKLPDM